MPPANETRMHPFRERNLDATSVYKKVLDKIHAPLSETEMKGDGLGYVYVLRSRDPSTQAELKIGFLQYYPQNRAQELARCINKLEIVARSQVLPHAKCVESLIHSKLASVRKTQWCGWCHRTHQKWLAVTYSHAREDIIRWSRFMLMRSYIGRKLKNALCFQLSNVKDEIMYVKLETLGAFWDKAFVLSVQRTVKRDMLRTYNGNCPYR